MVSNNDQFKDPLWGAEQLKRIPLFSFLTLDELKELYIQGEIKVFAPQTHAVIEGDDSHGMFLLLAGSASVYKTDVSTKSMLRLSLLEEGASFGELSLIESEARSATVISESLCTVFYLDAEPFHRYLDKVGDNIKARFFRGCAEDLAKRLRKQNSDYVAAARLLWKHGLRREESGEVSR